MYSHSGLKKMIKRENCLKQVLQNSSNLRNPHCIVSKMQDIWIFKSIKHLDPAGPLEFGFFIPRPWISFLDSKGAWRTLRKSTSSCLPNIYILPTVHSESNKARDGITQLSAMTFPSWAWRKVSKTCWPKEKPRNFSRLSASGAENTTYGSVTAREHNNLTHVRKNVIFHLPWGNRESDTNIFSKLFAFNYLNFVLIPTFLIAVFSFPSV